jgi:hypothetical protein
MTQLAGQGSLLEVLPSSHDSPGSCAPLPQTAAGMVVLVVVDVDVVVVTATVLVVDDVVVVVEVVPGGEVVVVLARVDEVVDDDVVVVGPCVVLVVGPTVVVVEELVVVDVVPIVEEVVVVDEVVVGATDDVVVATVDEVVDDVVVVGCRVVVVEEVVLVVVVAGSDVVVLDGSASQPSARMRWTRTRCAAKVPTSSAPSLTRKVAFGAQTTASTDACRCTVTSVPFTMNSRSQGGVPLAGPTSVAFERRSSPSISTRTAPRPRSRALRASCRPQRTYSPASSMSVPPFLTTTSP